MSKSRHKERLTLSNSDKRAFCPGCNKSCFLEAAEIKQSSPPKCACGTELHLSEMAKWVRDQHIRIDHRFSKFVAGAKF